MTDKDILNILTESRALLSGHFLLTSGLHSPNYIEKFRLLENPGLTEKLCGFIAEKYSDKNITHVAGPMTGGIILAHETGRQIKAKAIFTERQDGKMIFKRGFDLNRNDNVLIVEDIITTGGSVQEVIKAVEETRANIKGIACLVDRSSCKAVFNYEFYPLLKMNVETYIENDCPLCRKNIPLIKPGRTNK